MIRLRGRRRRRLLRLAALLAVIVGIVVSIVWITTARAVVPGVSAKLYPIHYRDGIARVAERYDLDPYLVAAVVKTESGYDARAVSPAGAVGLMQVMPDTAAWITGLKSWRGNDDPDLTSPEDNLELGACYLAFLMGRFGDDTRVALAAYNAGQGAVSDWVEAAGGTDSFTLPDIRFPETRDFVERVERYRDLYARVHPDLFADVSASA